MANSKIIDLDPERRLSKEALAGIQTTVAGFNVDELDSLMVIYSRKDGDASFESYGTDWAFLGLSQAYMDRLRADFLDHSSREEESTED